MYAPRVFFSMIGALLAFAVATYFIHGSFYTAFIQTLICAVILQVGYFIGILVLVSRENGGCGKPSCWIATPRQLRRTRSKAPRRMVPN